MRSAGCIINDIVDREYDKKVDRTKLRPIASGKIKVIEDVFGFCGTEQGVDVVNTSDEDQADTELLSELQADRTCQS